MLYRLGVFGFLISYKTYDRGSATIILACDQKSIAVKDTNSNLKLLEIFTFVLSSSDSSSIYSDLFFVPLIGAYLVPYLILLLIIGIPLFFLELAVGQRIRRGSIGVWNYISPKLGGIGFASCIVSFFNTVFAFRCYDLDFCFAAGKGH